MFQRIRGAIDRTIAEEQARSKLEASQRPSTPLARSASSSSQPKTTSAKIQPQKAEPGGVVQNPDPAVFEDAFAIDDSDDPSRSGTPKSVPNSTSKPSPPAKDEDSGGLAPVQNECTDDKNKNEAESKVEEARATNGAAGDAPASGDVPEAKSAPPAIPQTLHPEVKHKLQKLQKLESAYPELLRSYRVAHKRALAIEPFEKALRENTPLTSIADPSALIEFLNQLNLKSDMVMEELKRVSAENEDLKKRSVESEENLRNAQQDLNLVRTGKPVDHTADHEGQPLREAKPSGESQAEDGTQKAKLPVSSVIGLFSPKQKSQQDQSSSEEFFSYEDEIPNLQAEVASRTEEINQLKTEIDGLKLELSVARENSAKLVESLENAARQLSDARDSAGISDALQAELDERNEDVSSLTERLEKSQQQLKDLEVKMEHEMSDHAGKVKEIEASRADSDKRATELDAALTKASNAKTISKKVIDDLNSQIEVLKKEKVENQSKLDGLIQEAESRKEDFAAASTTSASPAPQPASPAPSGSTSKKKNKKKRGRGGAISAAASESQIGESETADARDKASAPPSPAETHTSVLELEIAELKRAVSRKEQQIERLSTKRKTEEDLREELETMQDNLIHLGQDHVEAKEKIKVLESEKSQLTAEITTLERRIGTLAPDPMANLKQQSDMDNLRQEHTDLRDKSAALQSDLDATQKLAQSRFKDLTDLREVLQKLQPELKGLRQDSEKLKAVTEELSAKNKHLNDMEKKEKELRCELAKAQELARDREQEVKLVEDKLTAESNAKGRLEEAQRNHNRELRKAEAEKSEMSAKAEKAERELSKVQEDVEKLRSQVQKLEDQVQKLRRENAAAKEEVEFKSQQYVNAQGLLGSMRDQTTEMSVQLNEAKSQAESLEEELAEVQRLLQERTREGETMRRLLADVDERADSKVRDMRARMEAAMEERDKIEDESSTLARRKARETEELRVKIRELEREVKTLCNERDDLEQREKEWKRRREELEADDSRTVAEVSELRSTVSQLRTALDASEKSVREGEKQRVDLRKVLEEARQRYEKIARELKTTQSKLTGSSGRSSMDSTRSGLNGGGSQGGAASGDVTYLKTVLLQFLEQRDGRLRAQLVPVLGKLLRFDKNEEQKWLKAVSHIDVR